MKQEQSKRASRLLGTIESHMSGLLTADPHIHMLYEQIVGEARVALGTQRVDGLSAEGRAMTLEQAVTYALEEAQPR